MNLHEIISEACAILHLGTEASMMSPYAEEFKKFANDAVIEISRKQRQVRTDIVELDNHLEFPLTDLDRMCMKVVSIQDMFGRELAWRQTAIGTGVIHVYLPIAVIEGDTVKEVRVMYQFRPARMVNPEDVPELPEFAHDAIPYFIAAQHCYSQRGGKNNAGAGEYYEREFQSMLQNMPFPYYGERASKELHNYNKGLI